MRLGFRNIFVTCEKMPPLIAETNRRWVRTLVSVGESENVVQSSGRTVTRTTLWGDGRQTEGGVR